MTRTRVLRHRRIICGICRRARAFDNMCSAIDMTEAYEYVSINRHKSWLPHGCIYKVRRAAGRVFRAYSCWTN